MGEPIPFAVPAIAEAEVDAVVRVLRSRWITTGTESALLEEELCTVTGAAHAVAVSSCTTALEIAFAWLALPPGARVGVPTWTFVASAAAPLRAGLEPVLLDVDPDTLNVSPASLAAALDEGLDAVVVVHFGGVGVAPEVLEMCAARGVPVVEDAAHALGTVDHRGPLAGRGTVGACLSFYATKNVTSAEGGALLTDDADVAAFARTHRLHGLSKDAWRRYEPGADAQYGLDSIGIKANLPDLLAALARAQLSRFDELQARRRAAVERYRAHLEGAAGLRPVPAVAVDGSADHLMVVMLDEGTDRARLVGELGAAGIGTSVHFQPLHRFPLLAEACAVAPGGLATAEALAPRALSLPLHPDLTLDQVDRVCEVLLDALSGDR
ncbi:MAG TPA: DegT/DnrJ/EryC1/StrS aminotransferase family protein [Iamia sp.]|nr:DegT/DnrJ/EryC1/StrS aminotransferase family protein [Iamia sp.]